MMTQDSTYIYVHPCAFSAIEALERAGFEAWCVGGCVRDSLLHREVNDYDIATSASWEQSESVLQEAGFTVHRTGAKHGTVTATLDGMPLEITTFRADGVYSDGRHPDAVEFVSSIEEDLARRDFTINAMAYHPSRGLLDCWGGLEDLQAGVLRTVGDPVKRFKEDGLRILRGCRFSSQLGFKLEAETMDAMKACKMMLTRVSAERITHELDSMLLGDHVHDALMETIDVLVAVMPEIAACKGFDQCTPYHIYDVWEHIAWVVQHSPATRLSRWAALFHDIGKPSACFFEGERAHFYGHAKLSIVLARSIMNRLLFSPAFSARVIELVRMHDVQIAATTRSVRKALMRLEGDVELFKALVHLKRADALSQSSLSKPRLELAGKLERIVDEVVASDSAFTVRQLAIDGKDIMDLGVKEGPHVGALLHDALDAVIEEDVRNVHDELIAYVKSRID